MKPTAELDVSAAAHLFADRSRSRVVRALMDGRALPASRLAEEASVSPQTISSHLAQLLDAGFVTVEQSGRHRYYALAGPEVADAFEALGRLGTPEPVTSLRQGTRAQRLRSARTCYDHLAGRYGVAVTQHLLDRGALVRDNATAGVCPRADDAYSSPVRSHPYALGPRAGDVLGAWGVDLGAVEDERRETLRFCMDWTEQRHHLAGALGAAVLLAFLDRGWVAEGRRPRELTVTAAGERLLAG
jgi:DNA-binding transcriptional ArsR family regulator